METAIGIIIGGLITWVVSLVYYRKASDDLRKEAAELRRLSAVLARGMEEEGRPTFARDESGDPTGVRGSIAHTMKGYVADPRPED